MHIEKLLSNTLVVDVGVDLLYTNKGLMLVQGLLVCVIACH